MAERKGPKATLIAMGALSSESGLWSMLGPAPAATARQAQAGGAPFLEDLAAEAVAAGGAATGGRELAGLLHQAAAVQQAPEVGGVQALAGQGLDNPLQLAEGEGGGQQFKDDGAVAQLAAEATDGGGQDAAVIMR